MATKFKQNLDVTGNITLSGQVSAQGNVTLGDADTDSVTFGGDVHSSILPNTFNTYDLGSKVKAWGNLYLGTSLVFEGTSVDANELTIGAVNPTADRTINFPNSTGTVATEEWVNSQGYGAGAGGSINGLSDVDTNTSAPTSGQVLKWDGNNWIPQNDTASSYTDSSVNTHLNQSTATSNQVLSWSGTDYTWVTNGSGSLSDVVGDTTPQLGGNLDLNSKDITGTGNVTITGNITLGSGNLTTTGKLLFSNVYSAEADLPSATTYHGMFAHVHATGAGYFAHGGNWIKLANDSQLSSYQTTAGLNGAIDTHLNQSNPTSGYVLSWNGSDYAWVANSGGGGSTNPAGADTQVQYNNSGSFGAESDFTYNASTNTLSVVNLTATNITTTGSGSTTVTAGANIELNATNRVLVTDTPFRLASFTTTQRNALASPVNGDMIYNSTTNQLESYENSAWVATAGSGGGGSGDITRVNITAGTGLTGTQDTTTGDHTQTLSVNASQTQITSVGTLTGLTVSGDANFQSSIKLTGNTTKYIEFEGTSDAYETRLYAKDTTSADKSIYLPNKDGEVLVMDEQSTLSTPVPIIQTGPGALGTIDLNGQGYSGNIGSPYIRLYTRKIDSDTIVANDALAQFIFYGENASNAQTAFADIKGFRPSVTNANENGELKFHITSNGTLLQEKLSINKNGINVTGAVATTGRVEIGDALRYTFVLGANGSSDYTFSDAGNVWFPTTENDPVLYLRRGEQYMFTNNSGGSHPFEIRVSNGGSAYSTGVTNNGASSGNIIFKVPMSAPATLYYQCTSHSGMGNTINIV